MAIKALHILLSLVIYNVLVHLLTDVYEINVKVKKCMLRQQVFNRGECDSSKCIKYIYVEHVEEIPE